MHQFCISINTLASKLYRATEIMHDALVSFEESWKDSLGFTRRTNGELGTHFCISCIHSILMYGHEGEFSLRNGSQSLFQSCFKATYKGYAERCTRLEDPIHLLEPFPCFCTFLCGRDTIWYQNNQETVVTNSRGSPCLVFPC
jgi:hypothetical protein